MPCRGFPFRPTPQKGEPRVLKLVSIRRPCRISSIYAALTPAKRGGSRQVTAIWQDQKNTTD
jgi:hypothetical protein